jgi:hypothetical protein
MSNEERQTNKFGSGIGGMPPYKAEMRRVLSSVSDVKTSPAVDSSLKSEDDDDFFKELDEGIERRKRADCIRKNHEVVKGERKASEHECIRGEESGRLQEAQAQLEQMERLFQESQEQNRLLREALAQTTTGYDTKRWLYHTQEDWQRPDEESRRDDQRITGRQASVQGRPRQKCRHGSVRIRRYGAYPRTKT